MAKTKKDDKDKKGDEIIVDPTLEDLMSIAEKYGLNPNGDFAKAMDKINADK